MSRDTALEARTIDDRYVVETALGHGAMGAVFRCHHRFTGAKVAVKLLHPQVAADGYDAQRFLAEARAPGAIGHPGITSILDAGRTPQGELYLVMELLDGEPLRAAARDGLAVPAIERIGVELLDAIAAAHAAGFVHRDIKPENLFVTRERRLKLLDFGIAKVLRPTTAHQSTAFGAMLGTPAYMAPEQFMDTSTVDARADLWSIGVVLHELLSGNAPFTGPTVTAIASAVATVTPPSPTLTRPGLPPGIDAFLARALAKDVKQRFQSAAEMLAAWRALGLGGATTAVGYAETVQAGGAVAATAAQTVRDNLGRGPAGGVNNTKMIIGVGAAAALMIIVAAAISAGGGGGGGGDDEKPATGNRQPATGNGEEVTDAASVTRNPPADARDPAPATRDPAPVTRQPPPDLAPTPVAVVDPRADMSAAEVCETGCAMLSRCGLADGRCESFCIKDPNGIACLRKHTNCTDFAVCALGSACGGKGPRGTTTCGVAAACEGACNNDLSCVCGCVARTRRASAQALFLVNACALLCGGNLSCIQQQCAAPLDRCSRQ